MAVQRLVIHVIGVPLALGKQISSLSGGRVRVVELHELLPAGSPGAIELASINAMGSWQQYRKRWGELLVQQLERTLADTDRHAPLLLLGIAQHPAGPPDDKPLELSCVTHRFIVEPDYGQLLRQFYGPFIDQMRDDDAFWTAVAEKRILIPASVDIMRDADRRFVWHVEHGYRSVAAADMLREISSLL